MARSPGLASGTLSVVTARVTELWRYPVKSMMGERLESAFLGPDGVEGDRGFALRDARTGRVLSAKKVSRLLGARARMNGDAVKVALPDGSDLEVSDDDASRRLTDWLGSEVELIRAPGGTERPIIEGEERPFRGRAGGFFDSSAVHILTTATLRTLSSWHTDGLFDPRRFRPNVVLETPGDGFVEEGWIGRTLHLGDADVEITKPCSRCVMTTHAMDDLPVDRDILRTVIARNDEHAGVYGIVRRSGTVRIDDEALLTG
jgi:uncharacterized protein